MASCDAFDPKLGPLISVSLPLFRRRFESVLFEMPTREGNNRRGQLTGIPERPRRDSSTRGSRIRLCVTTSAKPTCAGSAATRRRSTRSTTVEAPPSVWSGWTRSRGDELKSQFEAGYGREADLPPPPPILIPIEKDTAPTKRGRNIQAIQPINASTPPPEVTSGVGFGGAARFRLTAISASPIAMNPIRIIVRIQYMRSLWLHSRVCKETGPSHYTSPYSA